MIYVRENVECELCTLVLNISNYVRRTYILAGNRNWITEIDYLHCVMNWFKNNGLIVQISSSIGSLQLVEMQLNLEGKTLLKSCLALQIELHSDKLQRSYCDNFNSFSRRLFKRAVFSIVVMDTVPNWAIAKSTNQRWDFVQYFEYWPALDIF